jgi:hypothetical protein
MRAKSKPRRNFGICALFTAGMFGRAIESGWDLQWGNIMDPKLVMLVVLFGAIIALSYLNGDNLARLRRRRKAVTTMDAP